MVSNSKLILRVYVPHLEASFLEWLAYHRSVGGARHGNHGDIGIVVFVDRDRIEHYPLLKALAAANIINLLPMEGDNKKNFGEHGSTDNFGLTLTPEEYLLINDRNNGIARFLAPPKDAHAGDFVVPVRIASTDTSYTHKPGPILQRPRAIAPATKVKHGQRVRALDASGSTWSNNPAPLSSKAFIIKIPAPCIETFLLRQQMLPEKRRPLIEAQIEQLTSYVSIDAEPLAIDAMSGATARQIATLLALPNVAEAYHEICNAEATACVKLRADSSDFQSAAAVFANRPDPQATAAKNEPAHTSQDANSTEGADSLLAAQSDLDISNSLDAILEDTIGQSPIAPSNPDQKSVAKLPLWLGEIHMGGENEGFYVRLKNHSIVCIQRDPASLMVTFDNLSNVDDTSPDREPWAYKLVHENGYSHLSVMARRKDWYRDPQLIRYLQKLRDEGFFKAFKKVIFSGTSMGGFAALTFSSLSPGATVISFSPQTTLEEALVPWEDRFAMGRARDWSLPHSDCSYEIDDVKKAFVLYDPFFEPDRRHVERLDNPNVVFLKTWCSGHFSPVFLRRAGLLKPLMQHAMDETLSSEVFYEMFRARRMIPWYRKSLISNLEDRGHHKLASLVTPAFRKLRNQAAE